MARVPLFEQNRLASALTGTPGEYTAVSQNLGNVAQQASGIGNTIAQVGRAIFEDQLQERRRKEAELRAYNNRLKEMERGAKVQNKLSGLDKNATDLMVQLKKDNPYDPDKTASMFEEQFKTFADQTIESETDPLSKAELQKDIPAKAAQYRDNLARWSESRQVPIMDMNIESIVGNLSTTLSNRDLPAADVGQKLADFRAGTQQLYMNRYGNAGPVKQREDMAPAIKNYLEATALTGNAQLLEDRVAAFSGGSLIDPSKLKVIVNEQRAIVAQERQAAALEEQKVRHISQRDAYEEIINSTPTGNLNDADPAVIQKVLKERAKDLSNEDVRRFQQLTKQSAEEKRKENEKQGLLLDEKNRIKKAGDIIGSMDRTVPYIDSLLNASRDKSLTIPQRQEALARMASAIALYNEKYSTLQAISGSLTTPEGRALKSLLDTKAFQTNKMIKDRLGGAAAQKSQQAETALLSKISPGQVYADPNKQKFYKLFYDEQVHILLDKAGHSEETVRKILDDDALSNRMRSLAAERANKKMQEFGF